MEQLMTFISTNTWVLYVGLAVLIPLFIIVLKHNSKKKKINEEIENFQSKINSLKSYPFPHNLNKAEALAKINKDIAETISDCRKKFNDIQDEIKAVQIMINDSDELFSIGKIKLCQDNNKDINERLSKLDSLCKELDGILTSILQQETNQRNEIVDLKETYRQLRNKANQNANIYSFCWKALDTINQHISELFTEFESVMMGLKYDEASIKKKEIATEIEVFNEILDIIPELIKTAKNNIPSMIEQIETEYTALKKQGVYLAHLDVAGSVSFVNESLINNLNKIKQCDLNGVNDSLFECETKMNQLYSNIQEEKHSFDQLVNINTVNKENLEKLNNLLGNVEVSLPNADQRYGFDGYKEKISRLKKEASDIESLYQKLCTTIESKQVAASTILSGMSSLNKQLVHCLNETNNIASEIAGAQYDESKARQHLSEWSYALNEVMAQVRLNRISGLSKSFEDDMNKAFEYIKDIENHLNNPPIDIASLNTEIKNSNTFISELCRNCIDKTINNSKKAERLLVLANRYRDISTDIDTELTRAESIYRQGNYSSVITTISNIMRKYDASKVDEIIQGK